MATYSEVQGLIQTNLQDSSTITATEHRQVEQALLDFTQAQWLVGDIKMVDCNTQYIIDNFDETGLGKNERLGWAICNGNNNTKNRNGLVPVAYGSSYTTIGATGGSATHTLSETEMPAHTHFSFANLEVGSLNNLTNTQQVAQSARSGTNSSNYGMGATSTSATTGKTSTTGGGQSHNNMQPYIITLFIQKL